MSEKVSVVLLFSDSFWASIVWVFCRSCNTRSLVDPVSLTKAKGLFELKARCEFRDLEFVRSIADIIFLNLLKNCHRSW